MCPRKTEKYASVYTPGVAISIAALVVALCSLMWNVTSTWRTWRMNSPLVKMKITVVYYSDSPSLRIEVQNNGGSSIGISAIYIWSQLDDNGQGDLGFQIRREVAGKRGRISGVKGPIPPVTVDGHGAQAWVIKPTLVNELLDTSHTASILIEVQLANGKNIVQTMTAADIY